MQAAAHRASSRAKHEYPSTRQRGTSPQRKQQADDAGRLAPPHTSDLRHRGADRRGDSSDGVPGQRSERAAHGRHHGNDCWNAGGRSSSFTHTRTGGAIIPHACACSSASAHACACAHGNRRAHACAFAGANTRGNNDTHGATHVYISACTSASAHACANAHARASLQPYPRAAAR